MGMASTQMRLLALTSRMHVLQLTAQTIMNDKIRLASDEDAAYEKYNAALNAKKITVAYSNNEYLKKYVDANFSTLCGFNTNRLRDYILTNNITGNIIVTDDIKQAYDSFGNDKYAFAWACLGFESEDFFWQDGDQGCAEEIGFGTSQTDYGEGVGNCFMTGCERTVFNENVASYPELQDMYDNLLDLADDPDATQSEKDTTLKLFRDTLYTKLGSKILELMNQSKQGIRDDEEPDLLFDDLTNWSAMTAEFRYYVALWDSINNAGGCEVIDPQYETGQDGTEWFNNMVNAGLLTISFRDRQEYTSSFTETSILTSIGNNCLQEEQDDSLVKKAEAEYKHTLNVINKKDTEFDTMLKKTEEENEALKTERDSLKQIIKDNQERSFGIFS